MVKLIRKESIAKNPATLKDLINIALSDPSWKPLNWIELDLSEYSRDAVTGSGLTNGVNKGVLHRNNVCVLAWKNSPVMEQKRPIIQASMQRLSLQRLLCMTTLLMWTNSVMHSKTLWNKQST